MNIRCFFKNPYVKAFLCGLCSSLAFEPYRSLIFLLIGIVSFLFVLSSVEGRKKTILIYLTYTYSYFLFNLYWIQLSFTCIGLWYVVPFAALSFPLLLCLFFLPSAYLFSLVKEKPIAPLAFACSFWVGELLLSHLFTGFPWVLSAYCLHDFAMQGGAYIGAYGMSLITLLWCVQFYKASYRKMTVTVFLMIIIHLLGFYRLTNTLDEDLPINVRLVHPDIDQKSKLDAEQIHKNLDRHLALSMLPAEKPLDLIIWPEAVVPYAINKSTDLLRYISESAPQDGLLVAGAPRIEDEKVYTSAYLIDDKENIKGVYDKIHLVPFGEYLPFRNILGKFGFDKMTKDSHDYSFGCEQSVYPIKEDFCFSILICYEIIFPNYVVGKHRPTFLINMTNDAWYLKRKGPYQHLNIVRWRAIEEGIPILRAVNQGISAIIDGVGKIRSSLPMDKVGVVDAFVPKPLPSTPYVKLRLLIKKLKENLFFWI